jgi:hypothetical protein
MLRHLTVPALALASTFVGGCIVVDSDVHDPCCDAPVIVNYAPEVYDGEAGCYYDRAYRDDIWYFEAFVDDPDGVYDVISVWADVYDEYDGSYVESFELFPTDDPYVWYSDWLGHSTWLDCYYRDYTVDLVAYDSYEDTDVLTLVPYTY